MFPLSNSSTATSTSKTSNVSIDPINFINHFVDALGKRFDESQKSTRDLAIRINNQLQALSKGKNVDYSYSTSTLNPSSAATPTSISWSLYSMPPNYFAGQSPPPRSALPIMAEPVRLVWQWPARQHKHRLHQFLVWLALAEHMNKQILIPHILM